MTRKLLPIGIQKFDTLRNEGFYYVDKTPLIRQLVHDGRNYFLSRPRRFGNTLLVDTLKALFEGRKDLFEGLDAYNRWDWSKSYPVVRFSFNGKYNGVDDIDGDIIARLEDSEPNFNLAPARNANSGARRMRNVLSRLYHKTGQPAVVLIDEYDKPILDALPDQKLAVANRDYLRGVFGIIKGSIDHIRFTFITGISQFARLSLFRG